MNIKKYKIIFFISLLLIINAIIVTAFLLQQQKGRSHAIVLTNNGFEPDNITINKGDRITFSTNTGKLFWPASNVHPSHEIYPAFDPQKPITADATWSFTFDKVGSWKFHDHLTPMYIGKINVQMNPNTR